MTRQGREASPNYSRVTTETPPPSCIITAHDKYHNTRHIDICHSRYNFILQYKEAVGRVTGRPIGKATVAIPMGSWPNLEEIGKCNHTSCTLLLHYITLHNITLWIFNVAWEVKTARTTINRKPQQTKTQ